MLSLIQAVKDTVSPTETLEVFILLFLLESANSCVLLLSPHYNLLQVSQLRDRTIYTPKLPLCIFT